MSSPLSFLTSLSLTLTTTLTPYLLPLSLTTALLLPLLHLRSILSRPLPSPDALPSFFAPAVASHGRHLPGGARNTFSYSVLYTAVDIDSLGSGALDLPFRLLTFNGHPLTKIIGLRVEPYLKKGHESFRSKLERVVGECGVGKDRVGKVWMMSMPSLMGFEGTNPLTTWFVYEKGPEGETGELVVVVLEVHNAFKESHCYVLRLDSPLRHEPKPGYDLAFTFPRSFHVSPFNSRDGYYRLDILNPFPPSSPPSYTPHFKVFLRQLTSDRQVKFTATLTSGPSPPILLDRSWRAFTGVLGALVKWPGTLLLVQTRTYWQAYKLHYRKKLALYPKPEPIGPGAMGVFNPPEEDPERDEVGVVLQRQTDTWGEIHAREVVGEWIRARAEQVRVGVEIVFHNEREGLVVKPLGHEGKAGQAPVLVVESSDPMFYTNLLLAPSPEHTILLAQEFRTAISDHALFTTFFSPPSSPLNDPISRAAASARFRSFTHLYANTTLPPPPSLPPLSSTPTHFTDTPNLLTWRQRLLVARIVFWTWVEERQLEWVLGVLGGRFVPGQEPWTVWDRAMRRVWGVEEGEADKGGSTKLE
ncbi:hypothetical protein IAT38_003504 [Cryptococcus sp. DSM 104549]